MNIAVFTSSFIPTLGGAEIALYNILKGLAEYDNTHIHLFLPYAVKKKLDEKMVKLNYNTFLTAKIRLYLVQKSTPGFDLL